MEEIDVNSIKLQTTKVSFVARLLVSMWNLHTQNMRRILLCCGGDVGIGVQGEACGEVAQHTGTILMSTPFWSAMVTKVWRRSWNLTLEMAASSSSF